MSQDTRTCYFPSGAIAPGVPCSTEEYTTCCDPGNICLDNGLCLRVVSQPYQLGRGSCTNQKWDQGCPPYCGQVRPAAGCPIVTYAISDGEVEYCCDVPVGDGDKTVCPYGLNSFTIPDGAPVLGHALLANVTSFEASGASTDHNVTAGGVTGQPSNHTAATCRETAIGAGVGVPLGVIALGMLAWALVERWRLKRARCAPPVAVEYTASDPRVFHEKYENDIPHEMGSNPRPVAEIMGSER
ncbi:hypothetical protein BJX61DRAFT_539142 [Aspergillus egyptiacus]|nr:hypothetical protein BJX61DRAFT_539142 [Aspergillus egyptiacus]